MLNLLAATGLSTELRLVPAATAIVSWNTAALVDTLELTVDTADGLRSRPLPYVVFEAGRRASLDGFDNVAKIDTDVVTASGEIVAVHVHSHQQLIRVAASTPPPGGPRDAAPADDARREIDVPECSQYSEAFPSELGWCAAAAIAMLTGAFGETACVDEVARAIYDGAYKGTGNWAFAAAYAARAGLAGAAAYLRDLVNVERFIAAGLPLALSIAWSERSLPGAPLERSSGHVLVVRGFDPNGDVIVNDPAQPAIRHVYERAAFARAWLGHGGVALLVAPPARVGELLACANA